jgi:hypothetical protein
MIVEAMVVRNPLRKVNSSYVFLPPKKLRAATTAEIAFTTVKSVQIDGKWRLLDIITHLLKDTVRELVVKLQNTNPSIFGLLTCLGAIYYEETNVFKLVFRMLERMSNLKTLRVWITASNVSYLLSDRYRLALQLALAVYSIHAFDMVYKSIRPKNIILFQDQVSSLGSAFLLSFEKIRRDKDGTRFVEDID